MCLDIIRCWVSCLSRSCTQILGNVDPSLGTVEAPRVGKVYAVLTPLQTATGTMTVSEREDTTTGNQQLLYLIVNSIINVYSAIKVRKYKFQFTSPGGYLPKSNWCSSLDYPAQTESENSCSRGFRWSPRLPLLPPSSGPARSSRWDSPVGSALAYADIGCLRSGEIIYRSLAAVCVPVVVCGGCSLGSGAVIVGCLSDAVPMRQLCCSNNRWVTQVRTSM